MFEKQRQKMIAAIDELRGRAECTEAVFIRRRPEWAWLAFVVVFLIVLFASRSAGLPAVLAGGLAGGAAGGLMGLVSQNYLVGYCADTIVVAKSGTWSISAQEIVAEYQRPAPATVSSGFLQAKVTLDGEDYQLAKQFLERFVSITGVRAA